MLHAHTRWGILTFFRLHTFLPSKITTFFLGLIFCFDQLNFLFGQKFKSMFSHLINNWGVLLIVSFYFTLPPCTFFKLRWIFSLKAVSVFNWKNFVFWGSTENYFFVWTCLNFKTFKFCRFDLETNFWTIVRLSILVLDLSSMWMSWLYQTYIYIYWSYFLVCFGIRVESWHGP